MIESEEGLPISDSIAWEDLHMVAEFSESLEMTWKSCLPINSLERSGLSWDFVMNDLPYTSECCLTVWR